MALYATNRFPGDGSTTSYEFNFVGKYIARTHVKVYQEDNATKVRTYVSINDSNFLNDTTLRSLPVTPVGSTLVIYRDTPKPPLVDFVNGSRFTEYNMDLVARQGLFVAMEALDAGDSEARQQLLDAIAVVVGLVDDATAAVSDATAAALAAATSAANAATSESQAQAAKVAAESANMAAQAAKTDAQASASAAAGSASAASTSASNAAGSASTASTQAGLAGGYAVSANTQATNAATSATNAGNSATAAANSATAASTSAGNAATSATNASNSATAAAGSATAAANAVAAVTPMACRVVVINAASRIVRLERCGGTAMTIGGDVRTIPASGVDITLPAGSTPVHIYAGWNGSTITLSADAVAPTWNATYGRWTKASSTDTVVAYVRPDGLTTPERFLRNYFNGHGLATYTQSLSTDYTATWDGTERQLISMPFLILPGDNIDMFAQASVMSTPLGRVGDLLMRLNGGGNMARARHTHTGETFVWHNYSCHGGVIQRGPGPADPAAQIILELYYFPISTTGNTFTVLGDGISTRMVVSVTPYKFA